MPGYFLRDKDGKIEEVSKEQFEANQAKARGEKPAPKTETKKADSK